MPFDEALFTLTPTDLAKAKRRIGAKARREKWIASMRGVYGDGPEGRRCKDCAHFFLRSRARNYPKCRLAGTSGDKSTDWRANERACGKFTERPANASRFTR